MGRPGQDRQQPATAVVVMFVVGHQITGVKFPPTLPQPQKYVESLPFGPYFLVLDYYSTCSFLGSR